MSLWEIMAELIRFMRNQWIRIALGAVLFSAIAVGVRYMTSGPSSPELQAAYDDLYERYAQEPAEVQFVVLNEDGTLFENSFIFDEYFSQSEYIQKVEEETGIKFEGWIDAEILMDLQKNSTYRGGLAVLRNTSSSTMTLRVLVAKSSEENLAIAKAYQKLLESNDLPILEGKTVSILMPAAIGEVLPEIMFPNLATVSVLNSNAQLTLKNMLVFGVAGAIAGAVLVIILLLFMRLLDPVIRYAFDYTWRFQDYHMTINENNHDSMYSYLTLPYNVSRIIVTMQPSTINLQNNNLHVLDTLSNISDEVEEIVMIVHANATTKEWFHQQYQLARLLQARIKIIHIYS